MSQEIDVYGVFVPALGLLALCALAATALLRRITARFGAHRLLWHPPLFDFGVFVTILGLLALGWAA